MSIQLPCSVSSHPLTQQKYIVPTPSIEALYEQVKKCILMRVPGGIVYAHTRYGKTYAIRYIRGMLRQDYPGIVTFLFGCQKHRYPSEKLFFGSLLKAAKHANANSGTVGQLRSRLVQLFVDLVSSSKPKRNLLIVFADEAQKLELEEYEWLREIHDELEELGIRMITFLVGQPQLKNQKEALKRAGENQIVGRFMIDEFGFRGVTSANDAASCLLGYDTAIFPQDSDWTFTRFCLPQAWQAGFRLQDCALMLWTEFEAVHEEGGFRQALEIPMTYFARAVEILLTSMSSTLDNPAFLVTPALCRTIVQESRFAQSQEELLSSIVDDYGHS
jgi:AAA domain